MLHRNNMSSFYTWPISWISKGNLMNVLELLDAQSASVESWYIRSSKTVTATWIQLHRTTYLMAKQGSWPIWIRAIFRVGMHFACSHVRFGPFIYWNGWFYWSLRVCILWGGLWRNMNDWHVGQGWNMSICVVPASRCYSKHFLTPPEDGEHITEYIGRGT